MDIKSLMVGDWVYDTHNRQNDRVQEIGSGLVMLNCNDLYEFDEIEPIPLTPEILEKNGFEKTQIHGEKQDDIFLCFDGEIIIEVGIYDPNFILIHYRYETPDGINSGELSSIVKVDGGKFYLHELQHALRLCGIEKEIEL